MAKAESFSDPAIVPVRRDRGAVGFLLSLALHAAVIGAFYITLPYFKQDVFETPPLVVDLVEIADVTAAPPKPTPKIEEEQPKPEPEPQKAAEDSAPKPEPPPPEPAKPEPPPPEPKPDPKPEPVRVPPPPAKPTPPKKKDDMAQLAELLKDMQKKQPKPQEQTPTVADPKVNNQTAVVSARATMTELDAIRSHIESCWRINPGTEGIENLSVRIRVLINRDGSVADATILDTARLFNDAAFRAFANDAKNSVRGCKGIPITPQHYDQLKDMELTFTPRGRIN